MTYAFDFENSLIRVSTDQTLVDIQGLINEIRTAEESLEGITHEQIAIAEGKTDLGNGVQVGITIELLGSWQLKFEEGNYIARVTGGNLVGGLNGDPIAYSAGVQTLLIQSASSTVVNTAGEVTSGDIDELSVKLDSIKAKTDVLENTDLSDVATPFDVSSSRDSVLEQVALVRTDVNAKPEFSPQELWEYPVRSVTDKSGFSTTAQDKLDVANNIKALSTTSFTAGTFGEAMNTINEGIPVDESAIANAIMNQSLGAETLGQTIQNASDNALNAYNAAANIDITGGDSGLSRQLSNLTLALNKQRNRK